jgi:hypothetical protein
MKSIHPFLPALLAGSAVFFAPATGMSNHATARKQDGEDEPTPEFSPVCFKPIGTVAEFRQVEAELAESELSERLPIPHRESIREAAGCIQASPQWTFTAEGSAPFRYHRKPPRHHSTAKRRKKNKAARQSRRNNRN